jgi:hypothetical protein
LPCREVYLGYQGLGFYEAEFVKTRCENFMTEGYRIGETDFECWDKLWKASPSDPDVDSEEWVAFSECIHEYFRSRYENFPDEFYFWNDFSGDRTLDLKIATLSLQPVYS